MATTSYMPPINFLLFSTFLFGALFLVEGLGIHSDASQIQAVSLLNHEKRVHYFQNINGDGEWRNLQLSRRLMIGSTMPTCTYNECRRCKYKCRAEQIPVDGNDPINSAYHYKCVCHR